MIYNWTAVTSARYFNGTLTYDPLSGECPLLNRIMGYGSNQGPTDDVFIYVGHLIANLDDIVVSVVQDFREAVGASFFDEAKDDPTLVPASCIIHIDAIVAYTLTLRHRFVDYSGMPYIYLYEAYKPAWKRARIYRREQAAYLKRWLVGDLFPDQEVPATSDGVPFYTLSDPIERSL